MPTNNVVPIDAEVARSIARRATKFRWFVACLTAVWLGALIPVLLFTPLPPLMPFLLLGALLVLAEHRFVLFGDETSMSGSIIVAIASVFVFADTAPLAGPMLVASLGGLYLPHLRQRRVALALSNTAGFGLSALGAASTVLLFAYNARADWSLIAASVVIAVAVDWTVNSVIVGIASGVRSGAALELSVREQLTSDTDVVALAIAVGALTASNENSSLPTAVLGIWIALAAFEIKLARRRYFDGGVQRTSDRILNASLIATTVLVIFADPGLGTVAVAFLALFLVQATDDLMFVPAAVGLSACGAVGLAAFTITLPVSVVAAALLASAFAAIETTTIVGRARRSGTRISAWTGLGLVALSRIEMATLAAIAGAVGLLAPLYSEGAAPPLTLACSLVVIAAIAAKHKRASKRVSTYR